MLPPWRTEKGRLEDLASAASIVLVGLMTTCFLAVLTIYAAQIVGVSLLVVGIVAVCLILGLGLVAVLMSIGLKYLLQYRMKRE